jgi:hypothetical protein
LCILCFTASFCDLFDGVLFIYVFLGQNGSDGFETKAKGGPRWLGFTMPSWPTRYDHALLASQVWAYPPGQLRHLQFHFLYSSYCIFLKMMWKKVGDHFTPRRSLEHKNM